MLLLTQLLSLACLSLSLALEEPSKARISSSKGNSRISHPTFICIYFPLESIEFMQRESESDFCIKQLFNNLTTRCKSIDENQKSRVINILKTIYVNHNLIVFRLLLKWLIVSLKNLVKHSQVVMTMKSSKSALKSLRAMSGCLTRHFTIMWTTCAFFTKANYGRKIQRDFLKLFP